MSSRRVLEVELAGCASLIRGYGSRDLVEQITGHPPLWVRSQRGWSVQEHTARDVVGLAESRGYDIVITGKQPAHVTYTPDNAPPESQDTQPEDVALW